MEKKRKKNRRREKEKERKKEKKERTERRKNKDGMFYLHVRMLNQKISHNHIAIADKII